LSVAKLYPRHEDRGRTSSGSGDGYALSDSKSTADLSVVTTPDRPGSSSFTSMKSRDSGMSIDLVLAGEHRHAVQCLAEHIVHGTTLLFTLVIIYWFSLCVFLSVYNVCI